MPLKDREKRLAYGRRRQKTEKGKEVHHRACAKYRQSEKGKANAHACYLWEKKTGIRAIRAHYWYINHKEQRKQYFSSLKGKFAHNLANKKYRQTSRGKIISKKHKEKHGRLLGFKPLNKRFEGAEGHHVDREQVIYLPKEMHRSIYHNVYTKQNMAKINRSAWLFLLWGRAIGHVSF